MAQDNRLRTAFLRANNINVMDLTSMPPDLSPIEHVWDMLDRRVRQRPVQHQTLSQLEQALIQEWNNLPLNVIRCYVGSMGRRCAAFISAVGDHTRHCFCNLSLSYWN